MAATTEKTGNGNGLKWGLGLLGILVLATAGKAANVVKDGVKSNIDILFQRVRLGYRFSNPFKLNLELYYKIKNGNPAGVSDAGFEGSVFYQGVQLGDIRSLQSISIPANAESEEIQLIMPINLLSLPNKIKEVFVSGTFSRDVQVSGYVKTNLGELYVDKSVRIV